MQKELGSSKCTYKNADTQSVNDSIIMPEHHNYQEFVGKIYEKARSLQ
jgi:hypothetical protein